MSFSPQTKTSVRQALGILSLDDKLSVYSWFLYIALNLLFAICGKFQIYFIRSYLTFAAQIME